jgi:hypothetical protein
VKEMKVMKESKSNESPFNPSFGQLPSDLLGRQTFIDSFVYGLKASLGDPNRTTIFSGIRGSGKTAILRAIEKTAIGLKWKTSYVVSGKSMLQDILDDLNAARKIGLSGVSAGALGFSVGANFEREEESGWRKKLTDAFNNLDSKYTGVLICIDEVQNVNDEIRRFATVYQKLLGDGVNLAVAMAGLPEAISDVLNDKVLTFLRRSQQVYLGGIPFDDIFEEYKKQFNKFGISATKQQLMRMTQLSSGYPFLIQLMGYHTFNLSKEKKKVDDTIIERAFQLSFEDMVSKVLQPMTTKLSDNDLAFLKAMSEDDGSSKLSDITSRMEINPTSISTYRRRLIESGAIVSTEYGHVNFAVPLLRDFMRKGYNSRVQVGFEDYTTFGQDRIR